MVNEVQQQAPLAGTEQFPEVYPPKCQVGFDGPAVPLEQCYEAAASPGSSP